ncbi:MAG TPA: type II toxin-antitoxin system RelE/ParE family toxin [Thermodesulfobacteriota bacterium]|jgi:mRNA-degrading endonuclease RelE of RelBE toxin-antitoxin system
MFKIEFTPEAIEDMRLLKKRGRKQVIEEIEKQLNYQPTQETRNRKRLRPNEVAEWELRVGKFRVFYDVNDVTRFVKVEAVGYKKGSKLFIHGEEYKI